jgi:GntR family transcriptional regulator
MLESVNIRTDSDEPPTLQAYRALVRMIRDGGMGPKMPPERVIAERLGLSRVTVRRVLMALQDEGLLRPMQGSGWYVVDEVVEDAHDELTSFTENALSRGLQPSSDVLDQSVRASTIEEADLLRIAPGAKVLHLERLRFLDDVPVAISVSQIPITIAAPIVAADFAARSLFEALRVECGVTPHVAEYVLQARGASDHEAELLDLITGAPVLQGSDVVLDSDGRVLAIDVTVYRGDRYRFRTTLTSRTTPRVAARDPHGQGAEK